MQSKFLLQSDLNSGITVGKKKKKKKLSIGGRERIVVRDKDAESSSSVFLY